MTLIYVHDLRPRSTATIEIELGIYVHDLRPRSAIYVHGLSLRLKTYSLAENKQEKVAAVCCWVHFRSARSGHNATHPERAPVEFG